MEQKKTKATVGSNSLLSKDPLLSWSFSESKRPKRDIRWYLLVIGIAAILIFLMVNQQNWTGLVLVSISVLLLIISNGVKSKNVKCAIYDQGIVVEDNVYDFNQFKSYWISTGESNKIKFQLLGRFSSQISMPFDTTIEIAEIRGLLSKYLPEEAEKGEDLVDVINRITRF